MKNINLLFFSILIQDFYLYQPHLLFAAFDINIMQISLISSFGNFINVSFLLYDIPNILVHILQKKLPTKKF
ncbi:hypothetical protein BpHYR1_050930 [Brachionus plicatilis]|uniref:Uncharacterized protein n=1 Tax=Brachionus plicatilis TaxID=10195 RepID=A0A3M7R1W3_BRAPC|nr:hypothetical protein BpHYR1_050930 [Brachionus plicatilis]